MASLIFLRFHVKTLTFIWILTSRSCVAERSLFLNAGPIGFAPSYGQEGYAEILFPHPWGHLVPCAKGLRGEFISSFSSGSFGHSFWSLLSH